MTQTREQEKREKIIEKIDFEFIADGVELLSNKQVHGIEFHKEKFILLLKAIKEEGITETKEKIINSIRNLDCEDYTLEVEERDKQIIKFIEEKI